MSEDSKISNQHHNSDSSAESSGLYNELKPRHESDGLSSKFLRQPGSERQQILAELDAHSQQRLKMSPSDDESEGSFGPGSSTGANVPNVPDNGKVSSVLEGVSDTTVVPDLFEPDSTARVPQRANPNAIGSPNYDPYAMTPWLKRRAGGGTAASKAAKQRFLLFSIAIILAAPCIAVMCAFSYVPNAPAIVATQIGVHMKSNDLILRAVHWGWPDQKYASGVLLGLANQRVAQDKKAAMELYDGVIKMNPEFPNGYMNRALNWENLGDNAKAHADFDKSISLNPEYALAYNNRGCLYMNEYKYDIALRDMNKAVQLNPRRADFYYNRALLYSNMGERSKAIQDLDDAQSRTNDSSLLGQIEHHRNYLNGR